MSLAGEDFEAEDSKCLCINRLREEVRGLAGRLENRFSGSLS